jgi:selenocysteine-specific elongation factor
MDASDRGSFPRAAASGIERIIVVINKIDLGDDEMIEMVKDEVRERLELTKYNEADIVPVSSKTGDGIDNLKEVIVANLRKLSKAPDADKPYLFIDRVFLSARCRCCYNRYAEERSFQR